MHCFNFVYVKEFDINKHI